MRYSGEMCLIFPFLCWVLKTNVIISNQCCSNLEYLYSCQMLARARVVASAKLEKLVFVVESVPTVELTLMINLSFVWPSLLSHRSGLYSTASGPKYSGLRWITKGLILICVLRRLLEQSLKDLGSDIPLR